MGRTRRQCAKPLYAWSRLRPKVIVCSADGRGERYLVAGDATCVWACGFTQLWDAAVAAQWSAALGG